MALIDTRNFHFFFFFFDKHSPASRLLICKFYFQRSGFFHCKPIKVVLRTARRTEWLSDLTRERGVQS